MKILLVALCSIVLSVLAQFSLKAGMGSESVRSALAQPLAPSTVLALLGSPGVVGGFVLYGAGAVVWLSVLAQWDVSKAYPLVGLGFVLTLVIGAVLGEQVTPARVVGVLLIAVGVWLTSRS